jgi:hypothetical protein
MHWLLCSLEFLMTFFIHGYYILGLNLQLLQLQTLIVKIYNIHMWVLKYGLILFELNLQHLHLDEKIRAHFLLSNL